MNNSIYAINKCIYHLQKALEYARSIGEIICDTLEDIIPDIEFEVSEQAVQILYFHDPTVASYGGDDFRFLEKAIKDIFPELEPFVISDLVYPPAMDYPVRLRLERLKSS